MELDVVSHLCFWCINSILKRLFRKKNQTEWCFATGPSVKEVLIKHSEYRMLILCTTGVKINLQVCLAWLPRFDTRTYVKTTEAVWVALKFRYIANAEFLAYSFLIGTFFNVWWFHWLKILTLANFSSHWSWWALLQFIFQRFLLHVNELLEIVAFRRTQSTTDNHLLQYFNFILPFRVRHLQ